MDKKIVTIGGKTYTLLIEAFDDEVEIDDLLQIDYNNLIGEMVTFPVIVNRIGIMLAEAESKVSECKLNLEVFEAKTKEKIRTEVISEGGKAPTVEALNNAVIQNSAYQAMRRSLINAQKMRDYLNSVFWSSKDKSDKISCLMRNYEISENTELSEQRLNGILIKKKRDLIK